MNIAGSPKRIYHICLSFVMLFLINSVCFSQNLQEKKFLEKINDTSLEYNECKGYLSYQSTTSKIQLGHKYETRYNYCIKSDDQEVIILFIIEDLTEEIPVSNKNITLYKALSTVGDFNPLDMFTSHNNTKFYPFSSRFNADISGQCAFTLNKSFEENYHFCVMRFLQKNDVAIAKVIYLFNRYDTILMENVLNNTENILRFKTLSQ